MRRHKYLCPHCNRLEYDSPVSECRTCAEDFHRMREVEKIIRRSIPDVKGIPPEIYLDLWKFRCTVRKDDAALEVCRKLEDAWRKRDRETKENGS